ncbi:telomere-protecting terminal protein Tpg [Streptomyces sp. NPDC058398]|uniref:telomere-protecting terminal protein Tpg n=1 Tax=Streptomyces sp. NPDC058398 TaxID=3346479 RepID=UPI00364DEB4B
MRTPRTQLADRLGGEVLARWQPHIRARAKQAATTTSGIMIDVQGRFGYTAPAGSTAQSRGRHLTLPLPPHHAAPSSRPSRTAPTRTTSARSPPSPRKGLLPRQGPPCPRPRSPPQRPRRPPVRAVGRAVRDRRTDLTGCPARPQESEISTRRSATEPRLPGRPGDEIHDLRAVREVQALPAGAREQKVRAAGQQALGAQGLGAAAAREQNSRGGLAKSGQRTKWRRSLESRHRSIRPRDRIAWSRPYSASPHT